MGSLSIGSATRHLLAFILFTLASSCGGAAAVRPSTERAGADGSRVVAIAASGSTTCAVLGDGAVDCWGRAALGGVASSVPVRMPFVEGATSIVGGGVGGFCATHADRPPTCWSSGEPTDLLAGVTASSGLVLSNFAACGIGDGAVVCGGDGPDAHLLEGVEGLVRVVAGPRTFFTLDASGRLGCAGANFYDVCLRGYDGESVGWAPASLTAVVRDVVTNGAQACAILDDHEVQCWGAWGSGGGATEPTPVPELAGAVALALSQTHLHALSADGRVLSVSVGEHELVTSAEHAVAITAGENHAAALLDDGRVVSWGFGDEGQLGDGRAAWSGPRGLPDVVGARQVVVAPEQTYVVVGERVLGWGLVDRMERSRAVEVAQVAEGERIVASGRRPRVTGRVLTDAEWEALEVEDRSRLAPLRSAVELHVGDEMSCGRLADRTVRCVARVYDGDAGYAAARSTLSTGEVLFRDVDEMAMRDRGTLVCVRSGEAVECIGAIATGSGDRFTRFSLPGGPFVALSVADRAVCAVEGGGGVRCAGMRTAAVDDEGRPRGLPSVVAVEVGSVLAACGRTEGGDVYCFGENETGILGRGDLVPQTEAVRVALDGAVSLAVEQEHACAVLTGGAVSCWGRSTHGSLGGEPLDTHTAVAARFGP